MRNFSKTLISMAAVMAVGSAMAAGAMAEEITPVLTIGTPVANETGTAKNVPIAGVREGLDQYTMIMVKGENAVEDAAQDTYTISDGSVAGTTCTIIQIDQNDNAEPFDSAVVPTDIADGNYMVVVGGSDGNVQRGYLDLSTAPQVQYEDITIGAVDKLPGVTATDAAAIARWTVKSYDAMNATVGTTRKAKDGSTVTIGAVDKLPGVTATDAAAIARWTVKSYDAMNATVGTPVTVEKQ